MDCEHLYKFCQLDGFGNEIWYEVFVTWMGDRMIISLVHSGFVTGMFVKIVFLNEGKGIIGPGVSPPQRGGGFLARRWDNL